MSKTMNMPNMAKENENVKIDREDIENTPFTVVSVNEEHFGCIGKFRITEKMKSKEEVIKDLDRKDWNRLTQVMLVLIDSVNNKKQ